MGEGEGVRRVMRRREEDESKGGGGGKEGRIEGRDFK